MKGLWKFLAGLFAGLLSAGALFLISTPPRGQAVELLPVPTPQALTVQVDGSVAHPGVYQLPSGSRVEDGILAAGGCVKEADTSALNLAAKLKDGEKLVVPGKGTPIPPTPTPTRTRAAMTPRTSATPASKGSLQVNINRASAAELEALPGIGPYLAQQIIAYRQAHGPFKRIEDILNVPGIGPKTFEKIKTLISVS